MNKAPERFVFIDGMRAIAALLVCIAHTNDIIHADEVLKHLKGLVYDRVGIDISSLTNFVSGLFVRAWFFGDVGVDMFFVISGFLITNILLKHIDGQIPIKNFYLRRFFKIIPSYACVVFVALYFDFINSDISFKQQILTTGQFFLFLQNYFINVPNLSHLWSLVVEEHFYLIYPIILWLIFKYAPQESKKFFMIGVCLIVILLVNIQRGIYHHYGTTFFYNLLPGRNIVQTTTFRVDALAFGCLLCILKEFWAHKASVLLGWGFIIFSICGYYAFFNIPYTHVLYYPLDYCSSGLLMAGIYITGFHWGVENRFLVTVGRSSYNMYLWHYLIVQYLAFWLIKYDSLIVLPIFYGIFILAGLLGTHFIERPFLRLGKKIIQREMLHGHC